MHAGSVLFDFVRALADVEGGVAKKEKDPSLSELLSNKGVLIGCVLFLIQQFSGINAVVYFSSSVFSQVSPPIHLYRDPNTEMQICGV